MRLITNLGELKKGDTVILKDHEFFSSLGFARVFGEVFDMAQGQSEFTIKCKETDSIEKVSIQNGKIFLIG